MDLQTYLNKMLQISRDKSFENSPQITLGELIKQIEEVGAKREINGEDKTICFDFGYSYPTTLDSWRGSYNELALGYKFTGRGNYDENFTEPTAESLLTELKSAIGKVYTGWKGGEFIMNENTPLWVSNPGDACNTGIIGILDKGYELVIITAYCEF